MVSLSERNGLAELPEGCVAHILSWTTPKDAGRACAVSHLFRAAADSDAVWSRMLRSDWQAIIARSVTPLNFPSLKHLYLSLHPILNDGATKSFFLDKSNFKKCYLLAARELSIVWRATPQYWRWISLPEESRFPEVAELHLVWWFDISEPMDLMALKASVGTIGGEVYEQTVRLGLFVMEPNQQHTSRPKQREDGWLEIELGQFFNGGGEDDELQIKLMEVEAADTHKTGLIVEGIEIRPTKGAGQDQ